ncbi:MAG: hypothetical protein ACN4GZ_00435 [Acidimicrobiales bacterium]
MRNEPELDPSTTTESGKNSSVEETVNVGTSPSQSDDSDEIARLVEERNALSAALASRTEQLREVLKDLHEAHQELARLRADHESTDSSIDWSGILHPDQSD